MGANNQQGHMDTFVVLSQRTVVALTETVIDAETDTVWRPSTIHQHLYVVETSPASHDPSGRSAVEIELKHAHWRDLDPVPRWQHLMIGVYMLLLGLTAIVGNVIVVWVCLRYRSLRTSSNLLVVNLALGDLLMCTLDFPLFVTASFLHRWPFGNTVCQMYGVLTAAAGLVIINTLAIITDDDDGHVCQMYGVLTAAAGLVTINTLAVISLDRYRAVTNRLAPQTAGPSRLTLLAVLAVWLYSLSWALAPVLGWGRYVLDGIGTTCTLDFLSRTWSNRTFMLSITLGNFVLPLGVIVFSYSGIWSTIRSTRCSLKQTAAIVSVGGLTRGRTGKKKGRGGRRPGRFQADLKTAGIILGIVLAFLLTWTPFLVVCLLGLFGHGAQVTVMTSVLPSVVAKTSTALNPVLYSISHPKVRRQLRRVFLSLFSRVPVVRRYTTSTLSSTTTSVSINRGS